MKDIILILEVLNFQGIKFIRNKLTNKIQIDLPTDPTKIIQMAGNFQEEFTHEIPIEKKSKRC